MSHNFYFHEIPFKDFLSFLFNSSTSSHSSGKFEDEASLLQDFLQLNMSGSLKLTPKQSSIIKKTSPSSNIDSFHRSTLIPLSAATDLSSHNLSSYLQSPGVIIRTATTVENNIGHNKPIETKSDPISFETPVAEYLLPSDNKYNTFVHDNDDTARNSIKKGTSRNKRNPVDKLAFYKNFSACYGKNRSKSSSGNINDKESKIMLQQQHNQNHEHTRPVTSKERLWRSAPTNYQTSSETLCNDHVNNNNHASYTSDDEEYVLPYQDIIVMDNDEEEGFVGINQHQHDDSYTNFEQNGSSSSRNPTINVVHDDDKKLPSSFVKNSSTKSNLHGTPLLQKKTSIHHHSNNNTNNRNDSVDLNDAIEKTMSLYLDAVKIEHSEEDENATTTSTSTSFRLFY